MKYAEKLKDPRWQKKRLEILERDKWMCRGCCETQKTLHVHHIFYVHGLEPWDVPSGLLITLCSDCHNPGPCVSEYKSCSECPDFGKGEGDCWGYGDPPKKIIELIGNMLNCVWRNSDIYGGHSFEVSLALSLIHL